MDNMVTFIIQNRLIGDECQNPCFLIAEVGVNHNGSMEQAYKMIDALSELDIDAIKFQCYITKHLIHISNPLKYLAHMNEPTYSMLKSYELPHKAFKKLSQYVTDQGLIFLATPFDIPSVNFLKKIVPAYKISSGDINNFHLLKHVALTGKPVIISTGIAVEKEVKTAVDFLHEYGVQDIGLLQCTTQYPAVDGNLFLNVIDLYKRLFPKCVVGFSDHSCDNLASLGAIGKGANIIERHFTLDKNQEGPDHKASADLPEMTLWVETIRRLERQLGFSSKFPSEHELSIRNKVRKGIVITANLKQGDIFTEKNMTTMRPVKGVSAAHYYKLIGKKTSRKIIKNSFLQWDDVYDGN